MRSLKAAFALLVVAMAATSVARAEPLLIRNSYVVPVADWEPFIVAKKELAKHWGTSYVMEAVRYQGTPPMITALANGELEIANLAYSTLGIAIENAGLADLRVITDALQDGVPGYFSNQFFVRKDSGIKKIEDLKGKVLATNAIGAGVDIAMKAGLKKHGLIDKRDYTVIETPFPTMPSMLNEKKVDLVTAVMPFALNPLLNEIGFPLFDQTEGMGTTQSCFGLRGNLSSISIAPNSLITWKTFCESSTGISTRRTTMKWQRSPQTCSKSRPNGLAGCSPRWTIIATRT